jgi:DNA (cytosine-5)-methyltransferase 1
MGLLTESRILSLCSGAGGLDLGVKLARPDARTVCYVEIDAYAIGILAARIADT